MLIGVDANEANVKDRVGSGRYTFELLKQFARIASSYSSSDPEFIEGESRSQNFSSRSTRTILRQFIVYLKEQPLTDLSKETANFKYLVFGPKKFWTQFALPLKLTFTKKPDVFFSPAHYGPRFSAVPYVVTIHDLSYLHFPELFKKNDLYQLTNWSKYSIENSASIIVPSRSTKADIIKNYHINSSKISVTYEGYDKKRFKPQPGSVVEKAKFKYKIKGEYIIAVGTLQPRKNIERLIEAFHLLVTSYQLPVTNLVVVGKRGWLYDSIFQKVKDLKIENNVIFTGFVPDVDLPALISGAKAYVNPSLWEGFGIPVIEAQACGVPVVVSDTSSLPEIVGDSAVLVDPESVESIAGGLEKVISSEVTRSDLIKKGLENSKRFSWETCAKETLKVLLSAAKNSPNLHP